MLLSKRKSSAPVRQEDRPFDFCQALEIMTVGVMEAGWNALPSSEELPLLCQAAGARHGTQQVGSL